MSEMSDVIKVAVDGYNNRVKKYSVEQSQDLVKEALIKANNGSTKINYRDIRDGKCPGLFTLIEEILSRTVVEGLQASDWWYNLVQFRNVPEGDKNLFLVEDSDLFVVSESADGTQGIRRQRIGATTEISVPVKRYSVRIYEELDRILAGRADFNTLINKVSESFQQFMLEQLYSLFHSATADQMGGQTYYPTAGSYDEDALLTLIEHVEASASGKPATLITTRKTARKLAPSVTSSDAGNDMYHTGAYLTFYGTPIIIMPQRHKVQTNEFLYDDNQIYVVAGDEKPILCVREGNPLLISGDPYTNGDLTQEYFYSEKWGASIVLAGNNASIGKYEITP